MIINLEHVVYVCYDTDEHSFVCLFTNGKYLYLSENEYKKIKSSIKSNKNKKHVITEGK